MRGLPASARPCIWKCDDGESEKWRLERYGSFRGLKNRCMDVPNSSTAEVVQL